MKFGKIGKVTVYYELSLKNKNKNGLQIETGKYKMNKTSQYFFF
jgi:hypothetical protein